MAGLIRSVGSITTLISSSLPALRKRKFEAQIPRHEFKRSVSRGKSRMFKRTRLREKG